MRELYFAKTQENVRFEKRGLSLARAEHLHTNVSLVCTSREFWRLFYLRLRELHFAKTQENVRFENEVCPCLVLLKLAHQRQFSLHEQVRQLEMWGADCNCSSAPSVEPPPLAGLKDRSDSGVAEGD